MSFGRVFTLDGPPADRDPKYYRMICPKCRIIRYGGVFNACHYCHWNWPDRAPVAEVVDEEQCVLWCTYTSKYWKTPCDFWPVYGLAGTITEDMMCREHPGMTVFQRTGEVYRAFPDGHVVRLA